MPTHFRYSHTEWTTIQHTDEHTGRTHELRMSFPPYSAGLFRARYRSVEYAGTSVTQLRDRLAAADYEAYESRQNAKARQEAQKAVAEGRAEKVTALIWNAATTDLIEVQVTGWDGRSTGHRVFIEHNGQKTAMHPSGLFKDLTEVEKRWLLEAQAKHRAAAQAEQDAWRQGATDGFRASIYTEVGLDGIVDLSFDPETDELVATFKGVTVRSLDSRNIRAALLIELIKDEYPVVVSGRKIHPIHDYIEVGGTFFRTREAAQASIDAEVAAEKAAEDLRRLEQGFRFDISRVPS